MVVLVRRQPRQEVGKYLRLTVVPVPPQVHPNKPDPMFAGVVAGVPEAASGMNVTT